MDVREDYNHVVGNGELEKINHWRIPDVCERANAGHTAVQVDVHLALSGAIETLLGVEGVAEWRELLIPQEGVDIVWLPEMAEDAFLFPIGISAVVD